MRPEAGRWLGQSSEGWTGAGGSSPKAGPSHGRQVHAGCWWSPQLLTVQALSPLPRTPFLLPVPCQLVSGPLEPQAQRLVLRTASLGHSVIAVLFACFMDCVSWSFFGLAVLYFALCTHSTHARTHRVTLNCESQTGLLLPGSSLKDRTASGTVPRYLASSTHSIVSSPPTLSRGDLCHPQDIV